MKHPLSYFNREHLRVLAYNIVSHIMHAHIEKAKTDYYAIIQNLEAEEIQYLGRWITIYLIEGGYTDGILP